MSLVMAQENGMTHPILGWYEADASLPPFVFLSQTAECLHLYSVVKQNYLIEAINVGSPTVIITRITAIFQQPRNMPIKYLHDNKVSLRDDQISK